MKWDLSPLVVAHAPSSPESTILSSSVATPKLSDIPRERKRANAQVLAYWMSTVLAFIAANTRLK